MWTKQGRQFRRGRGGFTLVELLVVKVKSGGMYEGYIEKNFGEDEAAWRDASPTNHVEQGRPMPRFLFASAEKGNPASMAAAERMVAKINAAGGHARHVVLEGKDHTAANHELGMDGDQTGQVLVRFVRGEK